MIWGFENQDTKSLEIIIADDGSNENCIARTKIMMQQSPLAIRHIWQVDEGFRKCRILNRAIESAKSEYLMFTDGDCLPSPGFVSAHLAGREKGRLLSGGYTRLSKAVSEMITREDIFSGQCFEVPWLRKRGMRSYSNMLKIGSSFIGIDKLLNIVTPTKRTFNGNNSSCFRADAIRINGFDERMGYGGEDREFGYRLANSGIRPKGFRYSAPCLHLCHDRSCENAKVREANEIIISRTRELHQQRTEFDIGKREQLNVQALVNCVA